ncbi:MAG: hypothetical protein AAFZ07_20090 [Actinomycetota bacterium]
MSTTIPVYHTELGHCDLIVRGDLDAVLLVDGRELTADEVGHGYLHSAEEDTVYRAEQQSAMDDYIVASTLAFTFRGPRYFSFGASLKSADQLRRVEEARGSRLPLA